MKIVIDQGHGYGLAHNRGGVLFNEGDQNFKFGKLLKSEIEKYAGVKVRLTRNSIYDNPSLSQRARMGVGADLFISTHTNAGPKDATGIEIFKSKYNSVKGNNLINSICSLGSSSMKIVNRGLKYWSYNGGDYWGVFNWGNDAKEKMLIEWCFHTNMYDSKQYLANQEKLAILTAQEIAKSYGLTKKNYGIKEKIKEGKKLYRVQLGAFENKANAEKLLENLAKKGFNGIIVGEDTYKKPATKVATPKKSIRAVALEVIKGDWGNGDVRKQRLTKAGYNYEQVQAEVNRIL